MHYKNELDDLDATAMADLVRAGEISALELVDNSIYRCEQVNGLLNAVKRSRMVLLQESLF
jgi:Asp-tRNA(Asn)/Glu-tRNA(Gln) amidotransferase A subunit family amidase